MYGMHAECKRSKNKIACAMGVSRPHGRDRAFQGSACGNKGNYSKQMTSAFFACRKRWLAYVRLLYEKAK